MPDVGKDDRGSVSLMSYNPSPELVCGAFQSQGKIGSTCDMASVVQLIDGCQAFNLAHSVGRAFVKLQAFSMTELLEDAG